jgi:xanthine dehydrogenase accessory factor
MMTGTADNHSVIAAALAWRGAPMALATVIKTWRSAPCPVGTHMLVHSDGRFIGSVSGGCVEGDVLHHAAEIIAGAPAIVRHYGVADGAAWEVGLPCGGNIEVLIQPVGDTGFPPNLFESVNAVRQTGLPLIIASDLTVGKSYIVEAATEGHFCNVYAPPKRVLIVGAVEIARSLAAIAGSLGIAPVVVDPRARFLTEARFPGVTLDDRWPDEAIAALAPDARTAVITLSHDIKIDDPALIAALASPAGHIAALGSRASHAARLVRLEAVGIDPAQFARIEAPAGMPINSISASEIALSIAAGMVRVFNDGLR